MIRALIKYPFLFGDTVLLVDHQAQPYVPLEKICDNLGLNLKRQISRCRRYRFKLRLARVQADDGEATREFEALPLENLAWWLFTLRQRDTAHLMKLRGYTESLPHMLMHYWSRYTRNFSPTKAMEKIVVRSAPEQPRQAARKNRRGMTQALITQIQEMHEDGKNFQEIANTVGYSRSSVSMAARGKYPCPKT